ncbi:Parkin coregulated gene protein homolog [Eumeta japonica]|uniref:Parkin coregulated gene protein homolog n=1 Tax=Eumeta variegata TaxID=151549 RepID=A0A4C1YXM3_EUMVA|nr:Parkin coregulated gene protein homolog [Eumeta japonica]
MVVRICFAYKSSSLCVPPAGNIGAEIDFTTLGDQNVADLIDETLQLLERYGGVDAFINIKGVTSTFPASRVGIECLMKGSVDSWRGKWCDECGIRAMASRERRREDMTSYVMSVMPFTVTVAVEARR